MKLPDNPCLKRIYRAEYVGDDVLILLSEHRQHVFRGRAFVAVAPRLDGRTPLPDIAAAVAPAVPFTEVVAAVSQLSRSRCIRTGGGEQESAADDGQDRFWEYLNVDPIMARQRLAQTRVHVSSLCEGLDTAPVHQALERAGVSVVPATAPGALRVVITDDYLAPALAALNRELHAAEQPWVIIKTAGQMAGAGPLIYPGHTPCWACLEHRMALNRYVETFLREQHDPDLVFDRARLRHATTQTMAAEFAVGELLRALALPPKEGLAGRIRTLDLLSLAFDDHAIVRRPQCPVCGDPAPREAQPVALSSAPARVGPGGNHRAESPEATFHRYRHHISPLSGIVTALRPWGSASLPHVVNYVASHYFPVLTGDVGQLKLNSLGRSGGKGRTEIQAQTSALCEALERTSGIRSGDEPIRRATWQALGDAAVHIRELAQFSDAQYAARHATNDERFSDQQYVPDPLPDDAEIGWTAAWSLRDQAFRHLPAAYCFYGHRDPGHFFCRADSNGCAAGNTLEEAVLQGFLELVERDAVALWWYNRVQRPAVDADSFALPFWSEMRRLYDRTLDRDLHVLDLTSDLGIATFAVVSRHRRRQTEDVVLGFGSHLDPDVALVRALEESNQYLPALTEADAQGRTIYRLAHAEALHWWRTASYETQPYLVPADDAPQRVRADFQDLASDDLARDVETCVSIAAANGLDVLVVDQTRPEIRLPVARVVVPGLRHFWRRLSPGRLYDVPVAMGWLDTPRRESEMNPVACFV